MIPTPSAQAFTIHHVTRAERFAWSDAERLARSSPSFTGIDTTDPLTLQAIQPALYLAIVDMATGIFHACNLLRASAGLPMQDHILSHPMPEHIAKMAG